MRLFALIALTLVAAVSSKAQPAPFAEAIVSQKLINQLEDAPRWESAWINEVVLRPLSAIETQAVLDRYKGRVPKPKLEAIQTVPPMYPFEMHQKKASGTVTAYLVIAKNGSVKEVYVTDYTEESFAKAAALSLKFWKFARLKQECLVAIPVPFTYAL
jgi:hypothetical protein